MDRKSIIFWSTFSSKGKLNLVIYETHINLDKYIGLVKQNVIPVIRDKYNNLYLFLQDSAPIYVLHKAKTFMFEAGMAVMKWLAYFLDLNPIENARSYILHKVYHCYSSRVEFNSTKLF